MKNIIVIYDNDDILFDLNAHICKKNGININKITDFDIKKSELSEEEKQIMLNEYRNVESFEHMKFCEGASEIGKIREIGAEVFVCSNSLTHDIADVKRPQIRNITKLNDSHIILNVINQESKLSKELMDNIYIFIDDSPYNISKSHAELNIAKEFPWNTNSKASEIMVGKRIIRVKTLKEANMITETLVRNKIKFG